MPLGLLPAADRWSMVGLIVGPALGLTLTVANLAVAATGDPKFLTGGLHTMAAATFITVTVSSLAVQIGMRIMRNQRSILAKLDEIDAPSDRYAAGYADGLDAQPGASVAQLVPGRR